MKDDGWVYRWGLKGKTGFNFLEDLIEGSFGKDKGVVLEETR